MHSIHQKGFDSFTTTEYAEGAGWLKAALDGAGWEIAYQPSHVAARDFPATAKALGAFDCVILSDIGANTLLLHPDTFVRSKVLPNRLDAIRDYVAGGGGLVMVGGYMTFQGIEGKAQYAGTAVEEALPVTLSRLDDRVECPQGLHLPSATKTIRSSPGCKALGRCCSATTASRRKPARRWSPASVATS